MLYDTIITIAALQNLPKHLSVDPLTINVNVRADTRYYKTKLIQAQCILHGEIITMAAVEIIEIFSVGPHSESCSHCHTYSQPVPAQERSQNKKKHCIQRGAMGEKKTTAP